MQKQIELIICQGLPASGKSTWSRKWVEESPKTRVRINRDEIRHQLGPYWIPSREKLITRIENDSILSALQLNYNVVVDATNLRGSSRFKDLLYQYDNRWCDKITLEIKSFLDISVEECILRDSIRDQNQQVGEEVIRRMFNSLKK